MRHLPIVIIVLSCLLASACGTRSVEVSPPADDEIVDAALVVEEVPTTTSTPTTTTTSTTSSTTTTTWPEWSDAPLVFDGDAVAVNGQSSGVLLMPSGWVVPVLSRIGDGWRVWTPCGREAMVSGGEFLASVDVVIDPGHGGSEPGAVGPGGTIEAEINLQVGLRTRDALVAAGYSVVMTRDADVRLPIVTRAEIGLALAPLALISVHHNAGIDAPRPDPGTEMFFQVDSAPGRRLAGLLYEETREALAGYDADWIGMSDAGAMARENREGGDYYGMLRRPAAVTSVIAEFMYIANRTEEDLLNRADVQDDLAAAVVDAIDRLVETEDAGSGFTEDPIFRGYGPTGAGRTDGCTDPDLE